MLHYSYKPNVLSDAYLIFEYEVVGLFLLYFQKFFSLFISIFYDLKIYISLKDIKTYYIMTDFFYFPFFKPIDIEL